MTIFSTVTNGQASDASQLNQLITEFQLAVTVSEFVTSTSLSGTATLTDSSTPIQRLNPNGANRTVSLPAFATTNHIFAIFNTGGANVLNVKTSGGTYIRSIAPGDFMLLWPDGSSGYVWTAQAREKLLAARTYYVATTGSDSNDGLSSGTAFLTLQKAINVCQTLDLNGFNITISVAAGTYGAGISVNSPFLGGSVTVSGDTTTPSNVVLSMAGNCIAVSNQSVLNVEGLKLVSSANSGIFCNSYSVVNITNKMEFGACSFMHIYATGGGYIANSFAYTISGAAGGHYQAEDGGIIKFNGQTITITGTPAIGTFATATRGGLLDAFGQTFSGSATGTRYSSTSNSIIFTNGGGANYFPGNVAGSTGTGGQYI